MASSFSRQIPSIVHLIQYFNPKKILDVGKGFGKYGFLIHEYIGIDNKNKINPELNLAQQSNVVIDAIEIDPDLLLPHLPHLYNKVYHGNVLDLYPSFSKYDLILMVDVIEHIEKDGAIEMLKYWLKQGYVIIVATPVHFFEQHLYESVYEEHISHWSPKDFKKLGFVDYEHYDGGAIYVLSNQKIDVRGFGNGLVKKIKRVARAIKNEL